MVLTYTSTPTYPFDNIDLFVKKPFKCTGDSSNLGFSEKL